MYEDSINAKDGERYRNMVQPEESDGYQQDQDNSIDDLSQEEDHSGINNVEVKY